MCVKGLPSFPVEGICASYCPEPAGGADPDRGCLGTNTCFDLTNGLGACLPKLPNGFACSQAEHCRGGRCVDDLDVAGTDRVCTQTCDDSQGMDPVCAGIVAPAAGYDFLSWSCVPGGDPGSAPACMPVLGADDTGAACESERTCASGLCVNYGDFPANPDERGQRCTVPCTDSTCEANTPGWTTCWNVSPDPDLDMCGPSL